MENVLTLAQKSVDYVKGITGLSSDNWKTLYDERKSILPWDMDLAKIFGEVLATHEGNSISENAPDRTDQVNAFGVWVGTLLAGEPGSTFWPETYLVGLDYAASGYSSQFLFVMASRIEEAFFQLCTETFDTDKATEVYMAFKRVFGVAIAVMVDCGSYSVQMGMQRVGINEKLFQRIRNQTIQKQVEEARELLPLIEWNDSLSVGIKSIDDQHRKLVDLLNRLHDSSVAQKGNDTLKEILNELLEYTGTHFAYEEDIMAEFGYPETAAHLEAHGNLVGQVVEFNESFQAGKSKLSGDLFNFLRKWLNGHIRGTDRKYTEFFLSHGVK